MYLYYSGNIDVDMEGEVPEPLALTFEREELIKALYGEYKEKRELVEELQTSRSTVNRAMDDLERTELVEHESGKYSLSNMGRMIYDHTEGFLDELDEIIESKELFDPLTESHNINQRAVIGSEIHLVEPPVTFEKYAHVWSYLERSEGLQVFAPRLLYQKSFELKYELAAKRQVPVNVILPYDLFERATSEYEEEYAEMAENPRFSIHTVESVPYGLSISEVPNGVKMNIVIYDKGSYNGFLINDTKESVSWAKAEFDSYLQTATERTDELK